jgi:hypothetical protein
MTNDPNGNHGEGDPEAAERFNDAQRRFVASTRGRGKIRDGAAVRPDEESELAEAERLGNARAAKGQDPATPTQRSPKPGDDPTDRRLPRQRREK